MTRQQQWLVAGEVAWSIGDAHSAEWLGGFGVHAESLPAVILSQQQHLLGVRNRRVEDVGHCCKSVPHLICNLAEFQQWRSDTPSAVACWER